MLLTLTTGIMLPVVAVITAVLLPFSDRLTQGALATVYFSYLYAVLRLAVIVA